MESSRSIKNHHIDRTEWQYEVQQRAVQTVLMSDVYGRGCAYFKDAFGFDMSAYDYIFTSEGKAYPNSSQKKILLEKLRGKIQDPAYLARVLHDSVSKMEVVGSLSDTVEERGAALTEIDNATLSQYWGTFDSLLIRATPWFWVPWYLSEENMLTDKVRSGLERHKREVETITDIQDAVMLLSFPIKQVAFQKEQSDFFDIIAQLTSGELQKDSTHYRERLKDYLRNYAWMSTYFLTPLIPLTEEQLVGRIEEALLGNSLAEYEQQKIRKEEMDNTVQALKKILHSDAELMYWIDAAQELAYALTAGVDSMFRAAASYIPLQSEIARRLQIPLLDTYSLFSSEIIDALRGDTLPSTATLIERKRAHVMISIGGNNEFIFGEEAEEFIRWIDDTNVDSAETLVTEIKGSPACRGNAKGFVRVAQNPKEADELKVGEILVCSMTTPYYVPAMKRAAAIVTDEGGLLSHAAIMSREFGKPCIIATKIATKTLKNGNLVEVDADKGVVRIIERV